MNLPPSAVLGARHARVRQVLDALGLDALIVTNASNIRYLTSHTGTSGVAVLTREAVHLVVDFRYEEAVRGLQSSDAACPGLRTWPVPGSYEGAVLTCLSEIAVSAVGFEAAHVSVARHAWWRDTIAARALGISLRSTGSIVERLRVIKDTWELVALRESASRLTAVAGTVLGAIRLGTTEREVAGVLEGAIRQAGYERLAFDTIVASGPHSALPHYRTGDRRFASGDFVVLDFGGILDGYCSDLTRTVCIGPPSGEARRVYSAVQDAQRAAIAAVRPGIDASAVDAAARCVLDARGLGEAFGHGTGHGLGLDVHEDPRITRHRPGIAPGETIPSLLLEAGMVFTIEPGAYLAGWGGVRIEDDVLVTEEGYEVLTSVPRELLSL
ncbi:MAG: Xaa-Pro peptidase family protein [Vicinamibacterales bacterium]